MYWTLFKVIVALFVPVPISPKIVRATSAENTWILTYNGFTSVFEEGKKAWKSPEIVPLLQPTVRVDEVRSRPTPLAPPRDARCEARPPLPPDPEFIPMKRRSSVCPSDTIAARYLTENSD